MHPNQIIVESQRKTSQELESRSNEALSAPDVATGNRHPTATTAATVTAKNINDNIASSTETVNKNNNNGKDNNNNNFKENL